MGLGRLRLLKFIMGWFFVGRSGDEFTAACALDGAV
jgi:hypothetical protein